MTEHRAIIDRGTHYHRLTVTIGLQLERAMYKHILIATDGSELAGKAVAARLVLAKWLGASSHGRRGLARVLLGSRRRACSG